MAPLQKQIYPYRHHLLFGSVCSVIGIVIFTSVSNYYLFRYFFPSSPQSTQKQIQTQPSATVKTLEDDDNLPTPLTQTDPNGTVIFHGDRTKPQIALTFDADMTYGMQRNLLFKKVKSYYDDALIQVLKNTHTKATLFLTGLWIETYPQITQELAKDPLFELGNHSYSHPSFAGYCYGLPQVPKDELIEEVAIPEKLLRGYTGSENSLFRFPGGCFDSQGIELVKLAGDQVIQWDVVGGDGFNANGQQIIHNVVDHVQNGSIIVMHMNGIPNEPQTAAVMPTIISQLHAKGYQFVTVSQLLGK